jgi:hypothetical protein
LQYEKCAWSHAIANKKPLLGLYGKSKSGFSISPDTIYALSYLRAYLGFPGEMTFFQL